MFFLLHQEIQLIATNGSRLFRLSTVHLIYIGIRLSLFKPPSPHICSYTLPVSISFSLLRFAVFVICLIRNLILTKFQIVHIHSAGTYVICTCLHLIPIPYIITPWGSDIIFNSKNVVKRPFLLVALRNSIHITCDAQFIKDLALTLSPNSRVSVINFGIDTHFFTNPLRGSCQYPHSRQPIRLISNRITSPSTISKP